MLANLPVTYQIQCRKKGHRSHSSYNFVAFRDFDLGETDLADAPAAISGFEVTPGDSGGLLRWHDGQWWMTEHGPEGAVTVEEWVKGVQYGLFPFTGWREATVQRDAQSRYLNPRTYDGDSYRDRTGDNLEQMCGKMAGFLRDTIRIVDGVVHSSVSEPFWCLRHKAKEVYADLAFETSDKDSGEYFRIDRWDDMQAHVLEHYPEATHHLGSRPDVLIPDLFTFEDEKKSLLRVGKALVAKSRYSLSDLEAFQGMAWFALRDAVEAMAGNSEESDFDEIARSAEAFIDSFEGKKKPYWLDDAQKLTRIGLSRWHVRPMAFENDFRI